MEKQNEDDNKEEGWQNALLCGEKSNRREHHMKKYMNIYIQIRVTNNDTIKRIKIV